MEMHTRAYWTKVCSSSSSRREGVHGYCLLCTLCCLQLDFLEHPAITDVIVCSVVLDETGHKNTAAHQRLRQLCASEAKRFFVFANEHHRCVQRIGGLYGRAHIILRMRTQPAAYWTSSNFAQFSAIGSNVNSYMTQVQPVAPFLIYIHCFKQHGSRSPRVQPIHETSILSALCTYVYLQGDIRQDSPRRNTQW